MSLATWLLSVTALFCLLGVVWVLGRGIRRRRKARGLDEIYTAIQRELPGFKIIGIGAGMVQLQAPDGQHLGVNIRHMLRLIHAPRRDLASRRRALDAFLVGAAQSLESAQG